MSSLRFKKVVVTFLFLSFLLHFPTEVEGGECIEILDFCITTSKCTERCLKYKGDKVVKSECKVPEAHPGQPRYPFRMCFCTYTCDKASEEAM
ncbi:unnamed protein product [Brassica rapa subsp. trilocularis]